MKIRIKRVYEVPAQDDGKRILVDRLWPRGLSKAVAEIDFWAKKIAPSNELRRWYGHDPLKWSEFKSGYFAELETNPDGVEELMQYIKGGTVSFVYGSKEQKLNNAVALKEYIESMPTSPA